VRYGILTVGGRSLLRQRLPRLAPQSAGRSRSTDCFAPRVSKIECVIVETPVPNVPYEVPIGPPAAAVANAIARATGVRIMRMPMTPVRVRHRLRPRKVSAGAQHRLGTESRSCWPALRPALR